MYSPQKMNRLLYAFSLFYRAGSQIKNFLYDKEILKTHKAPLVAISIGNISFGGSGKTPLAMAVLSALLSSGRNPALITRGYKGGWEKHGGILSDGKRLLGSWQDSGEEPYMVAQTIPEAGVFTGKDRLRSCTKAAALGFDTVVLDDAFQHRKLYRDLDIVLYDPARNFLLREPPSSLRRAHILLIKKSDQALGKKKIKEQFPRHHIFEYSVVPKGYIKLRETETSSSACFKGKKVLAFCGIARPERFFSLLQQEGIIPASSMKFPDHYAYPLSSIKKIKKKYRDVDAEALITTEKDAVKIFSRREVLDLPLYYLKISLEPEDSFFETLNILLQSKKGRPEDPVSHDD